MKLKFVMSGLIFFVLYKKKILDFSELLNVYHHESFWLYVIAGVLAVFLSLVFVSIRLILVLRLKNFYVPFVDSFKITLIGSFFGTFLPGQVTSDGVKMFYLLDLKKRQNCSASSSSIVCSVMIDRILGFFGLIFLSLGASFYVSLPYEMMLVPLGLLILGLAGGCFLRSSFVPSMIKPYTDEVKDYLQRQHATALFLVFCMALVSQTALLLSFYMMSFLIEEPMTFGQHLALDPLALLFGMIPITPGGLGLTEGAFSYLYQQIGLQHGATIGMLGRIVQTGAYIAGGSLGWMFHRLPLTLKKTKIY